MTGTRESKSVTMIGLGNMGSALAEASRQSNSFLALFGCITPAERLLIPWHILVRRNA